MSSPSSRNSPNKADRTAAVDLEVPPGVADDIEAVLRSFAEEAELDTSLVVDQSGFLIAGISSIPDVDVDSIGTLVAGASGATEGLTGALGEQGRVESLHLGEDRLLYLKAVGDRFILVGVSDSTVPAGILRDQADRIEKPLKKFLSRVKAMPKSLTRKQPEVAQKEAPKPAPPKSLRQTPKKPEPAPQKKQVIPAKKVVKPKPQKPAATPPVTAMGGVNRGAALDSVFEVDEKAMAEEAAKVEQPASPSPAPIEPKSKPTAIVENSPFEVDLDEEADDFAPPRPATTPVHLSVPAARKREAEAKQNSDDDNESGPKYSFELG